MKRNAAELTVTRGATRTGRLYRQRNTSVESTRQVNIRSSGRDLNPERQPVDGVPFLLIFRGFLNNKPALWAVQQTNLNGPLRALRKLRLESRDARREAFVLLARQ